MDAGAAVVASLTDALGMLTQHAFVPRRPAGTVQHKHWTQWARATEWKVDVVNLLYPRTRPHFCDVTFGVNLLVVGQEFLLTGVAVSYLQHAEAYYRFPSLFARARAKSFVEGVTEDVLHSLAWFTEFDDKARCLQLVTSGEAGFTPQGSIYPQLLDLLSQKGVSAEGPVLPST
jgi:hypothetical protein